MPIREINGQLIAFSPNKTEEEINASIDYWNTVIPKNPDMTFSKGFNDVQSIIFREYEKHYLNTADEEKKQWFEENAKEFGQQIGYYDSIALEKYYDTVSKKRPLTEEEQQTRAAMKVTRTEFENDMYNAYETNFGDITEVHKKYGYAPEDISIIDGLVAAAQNPMYTLGTITGMAVKDPELFLLNLLRIPTGVAKASNALMTTARLANKIKPKYMKRFESVLGRGVEGATYGAVYEGLHDLTFKGYIDPDNIEKGAGMGALLGTAFGLVAPGSKGYITDKIASVKAQRNMETGKSRFSYKTQDIEGEIPRVFSAKSDRIKTATQAVDDATPKKVPESIALPKGLDDMKRYNLWEDTVQSKYETNARARAIDDGTDVKTFEENLATSKKNIQQGMTQAADSLQKKYPNMEREEALGIAARNIAKKDWETGRTFTEKDKLGWKSFDEYADDLELKRGQQAKATGETTQPVKNFDELFDQPVYGAMKPLRNKKTIATYGAVGAGLGAMAFDDDPMLGAMMLAPIAAIGAAKLRPYDLATAKLKRKVYQEADYAKTIGRTLEGESATLGKVIQREFPDVDSQYTFVRAIEEPKIFRSLDDGQKAIVKLWQKTMDNFKTQAMKYDVFEKGIAEQYITHIFKGKTPKLPAEEFAKFQNILNKRTRFGQQRKLLQTINQLKKKGYDVETDPLKILHAYTKSLDKALTGAALVKNLKKAGIVEGQSKLGLIIPETERGSIKVARQLGYKPSEHPALKGQLVHPTIKRAIEDIFDINRGNTLMLDKLLVLNNALKRLAVSLSFFHAQALVLSGLYNGAIPKVGKSGRENWQKTKNLLEGRLTSNKDDYLEADLMREISEEGVMIGSMKTDPFADPGYQTVKKYMDMIPFVGKLQDKIDAATWDYGHDYGKVFSYLMAKEKIYRKNQARKEKGLDFLSEKEIRGAAAEYVNDAFGGINWAKLSAKFQDKAIQAGDTPKGFFYDKLATGFQPGKLKFANMFLFAPDWTAANFRVGFRAFGFMKDATRKRIMEGKKLNAKEQMELDLYRNYLLRAATVTTFLAFGLHEMFADDDSEFDLKKFWKDGRVNLGDGEEMVASKQIMEPLYWLKNPMHTAWNKSGSVPKMLAELTLGKEYVSFKHGAMTGPKLDRTNPIEMAKYFGGKITPISSTPFANAITSDKPDWGKTALDTALGSIGFPRYKRKDTTKYY